MAAGGGCDSRSSSASVRSVRTSRIGAGSSQASAHAPPVRDEPRACTCSTAGAAIAPLETRRQRLEQPRQHERQRLEPLDRPLELERRLEALLGKRRHERTHVFAARDRLPASPCCPSRAARSADGSAASSPSVLMPPTFQRRDRRSTLSALRSEASACRAPRLAAWIVAALFENADRDRRERRGFVAGIDHREAGTREREHERRHPRAGDRDVHPHPARRPPRGGARRRWCAACRAAARAR